jgi:hypothetical protein
VLAVDGQPDSSFGIFRPTQIAALDQGGTNSDKLPMSSSVPTVRCSRRHQ